MVVKIGMHMYVKVSSSVGLHLIYEESRSLSSPAQVVWLISELQEPAHVCPPSPCTGVTEACQSSSFSHGGNGALDANIHAVQLTSSSTEPSPQSLKHSTSHTNHIVSSICPCLRMLNIRKNKINMLMNCNEKRKLYC